MIWIPDFCDLGFEALMGNYVVVESVSRQRGLLSLVAVGVLSQCWDNFNYADYGGCFPTVCHTCRRSRHDIPQLYLNNIHTSGEQHAGYKPQYY